MTSFAGRDLLTFGALAVICLCAGLALNRFRSQPLPPNYVSKAERMQQAVSAFGAINPSAPLVAHQGQARVSASFPDGAPQVIGLAEFQDFVQARRGVVLDARPEAFHRLGHVTGALSLSREEFERDYAKLSALLEPMRDTLIAVYCSGASCEDSHMVADALAKLGYRRVAVFQGGWDEWTRAGLPEERQ